jgi:hypothetical protein
MCFCHYHISYGVNKETVLLISQLNIYNEKYSFYGWTCAKNGYRKFQDMYVL